MKLLITDSPYLSKAQWRKVFLATTIMILILYTVAMIFSLGGSDYFILNYQNDQLDKIESFLKQYKLVDVLSSGFMTLEFSIVLAFTLNKFPKWYYILSFLILPLIPHYVFGQMPDIVYSIIPFGFYLTIPIIDQLITTHKVCWKDYIMCILRLLIATVGTLVLQGMILVIKAGYFDGHNHVQTIASAFVYAVEYDIALAIILFTIRLYVYREKGDNYLWTDIHNHGGSSQTSKMQSQKSLLKNLTKTQRNKIRLLLLKVYAIQIGTLLLVMVLPFLLGKVLEFLVMYTAFCVTRYILGFKYSLHYKKEYLCATVGVVVFGILSLVVPFFYVILILAIAMGVGLAILLHLSYKYKGMYLFARVAKPDKFALLYTFFDGDLSEPHVKSICKYKLLDSEQTQLIWFYVQGEKISYLSWKFNYSQRMINYKLDEAIAKLIK